MIRPAAADTAALKGILDATGIVAPELLDGMIAGYLRGDTGDDIWLTVDDDGPVAVAYLAPEAMTKGTWNLLMIAVEPDRQRLGHGTALLQRVEDDLACRDERLLLVETSGLPDFERTRAFYRRRGYREEARIRDFYAAGDDKVVFRKILKRA